MTRAVFLDALGTLVELEPPWIPLRDMVPAEIERRAAGRGPARRDGLLQGARPRGPGRGVARRAARALRRARLRASSGLDVGVDELVAAIRFSAYPDAIPALNGLRDRGLRLVAVSNWDCSLPRVLEGCGLGAMLDATVTSAETGSRKPDPEIFAAALELAGCEPEEVLHVGDTAEEDVAGARAAGIRPLLIDRDGGERRHRLPRGDRSASPG